MTSTNKKATVFFLLLAFVCLGLQLQAVAAPKPEFYQLKIYHLNNQKQEDRLDAFLKEAYLPALHRAGIAKVGVFKPAEELAEKTTTPAKKLVYVFIPFRSSEQMFQLDSKLQKDKQFQSAGKDYLEAAHNNPVYDRMEVIMMEAFAGKPAFSMPNLKSNAADRVYELRSYEAATEKLHQNKIDMFNNGEMAIFDRLGFNAVFYGQVKAGSKMPNLLYMTTFENKAARDEKWKAFGEDPTWKKLSAMSEYANNFLRADIYLLRPTSYSDI
ncbi:NIPSNAP family protein [Rufibacter roseus]|uniref:NIPSNAP family protein n=1 Tax=Rufibacter roseus TaxID=1567108 RepID=A0ABW2DQZ2_9BACT|nr:NIPSNAP family protein [Rufibacter roseus]